MKSIFSPARPGLILLFFILFEVSLSAQVSDTLKISLDYKTLKHPFGIEFKVPAAYPGISYALSGGGARGISQIGVLKALEEEKIYPAAIVATSIGSIVGGLYSLGYSVDELDSLAGLIDWNSIIAISKRENRNTLFVDQKITDDKAIFSLRLDGLTPLIPTSINDGQKLLNQLNLLAFQSPIGIKSDFDELEHRFRAVCTNLTDGEPFVIGKGSLSRAMRASSSVSFFLSPVEYDSVLLADGGLVANIPVSITRSFAPNDLIIAVNTTSPLSPKDLLKYPWVLADQFVSIPMKKLNERELKLADILIEPKIGNKNAAEFTGFDSLVTAGYQAGKKVAPLIKEKIDSLIALTFTGKDTVFANLLPATNDTLAKFILEKISVNGKTKLVDIYTELIEIDKDNVWKEISASIYTDENSKSYLRVNTVSYPTVSAVQIVIDSSDAEIFESFTEDLTGKPFSPYNTIRLIKKMIRQERAQKNALFSLNNAEFNRETGVLTLIFDGGKIGKIELVGHTNTNSTLIFREIPISPGNLLDLEELRKGMENLYATDLFENFTVNVIKKEGINILQIEISEKPSQIARLGFKVDNENAPQINIDVRDVNFFSSGSELGLILFLSQKKISAELESRANRIFNTYFTYKVEAHYTHRDIFRYSDDPQGNLSAFSRSQTGEYRQINFGGSLWLGTQVGRFGNLIAKAKYEINRIQNITAGNDIIYDEPIFNINVSTTIDTKNKYPYPTEGVLFNGFYEVALSFLGANVGYTVFGAKFESYLPIARDQSLILSGTLGVGDKTLPLTQQFSIGGLRSFYGMREDEYRGRQLLKFGIDYRYRLPFKIFFDTYFSAGYMIGSSWEEESKIKLSGLQHGIGFSLSFDTPIGPAEFAIGRSFKIYDKPGNGGTALSWGQPLFYFSIGYYY
ncbi:MAG: patatin-like phospholipase family protein [Ignavibacteriales bacterium]|nr:MAG: BamA/TamA family outer membrane protein [Ignavibacteriaceae bacterium]MBW7873703.1 patatin-like phospholipase family protein [Ignavibacteria bacterium]MCZ2143928.1 patatin-like phospholipase family protein [Ignavibacteriales bacterium]MBV6444604.1 Outer membrane protein assembly factor BamA [Ignavibacteriaceae bacterium]MBZ0197557.1 patatin-like phospholipase family protein [Ignavibacteriaceae bacterium]